MSNGTSPVHCSFCPAAFVAQVNGDTMRRKNKGIKRHFLVDVLGFAYLCGRSMANIQERDEGIVGDGILYVLPFDTTDRFVL
ncbi:MAG: hypothetical protein LBT46_07930 [Planctomycetaceae bacterium]|jgi:hypothetical protein|nr:hypothetical protein [Planctomycetaceae bacterium]